MAITPTIKGYEGTRWGIVLRAFHNLAFLIAKKLHDAGIVDDYDCYKTSLVHEVVSEVQPNKRRKKKLCIWVIVGDVHSSIDFDARYIKGDVDKLLMAAVPAIRCDIRDKLKELSDEA